MFTLFGTQSLILPFCFDLTKSLPSRQSFLTGFLTSSKSPWWLSFRFYWRLLEWVLFLLVLFLCGDRAAMLWILLMVSSRVLTPLTAWHLKIAMTHVLLPAMRGLEFIVRLTVTQDSVSNNHRLWNVPWLRWHLHLHKRTFDFRRRK
jgi:hypothetical protein